MKLNQKLIQQLRNGEIAVENNGTIEQLREVMEAAFPESLLPNGSYKYYSRLANIDGWTASSFHYESKPTFKISDFYQPELFTGWAKDDGYPNWMGYFKDDIPKFGFCSYGKWKKQLHGSKYSGYDSNRPATHEEVEKHLIQEAKRRGYEAGITCFFREGMYRRFLEGGKFKYTPNWANGYGALSLGYDVIFREDTGQWAEIVEKPQPKKSTAINYLVYGVEYSFNYQELKARYEDICQYSDQQFLDELPQIAHLACIVSYFKGLGVQATISDKGIIHELIHLMTDPDEPTNDLAEIREKFNRLIKLS